VLTALFPFLHIRSSTTDTNGYVRQGVRCLLPYVDCRSALPAEASSSSRLTLFCFFCLFLRPPPSSTEYAIAGVVGIFFIRNVILSLCRFYSRQQKRKAALQQQENEKGVGRSVQLYTQKLWLERVSDRIDTFWMKPVWGDYTRIRCLLNFALFSLTFVFCLVRLHSSSL
jgi:hypothetical protein